MLKPTPNDVDILILGAGWTSQFLIPLLKSHNVSYAATTRDGRDGTIPFVFDPEDEKLGGVDRLPGAETVVVTFPLKGEDNNWIQLGSTGIWKDTTGWTNRHSPYDTTNERAVAEDEFMSFGGVALNLSGLYGGERQPRNWLTRLFPTKESLQQKGAVHLIHGQDVARAIYLTHSHFSKLKGQCWILTDLRVTAIGSSLCHRKLLLTRTIQSTMRARKDTVIAKKGRKSMKGLTEMQEPGQIAKWVLQCMDSNDIKALPRDTSSIGRRVDGREFWSVVGSAPSIGRVG
ncbi:MAG: hypothetical protein Q9162_000822 [Coniocarpon cinnabarinum]